MHTNLAVTPINTSVETSIQAVLGTSAEAVNFYNTSLAAWVQADPGRAQSILDLALELRDLLNSEPPKLLDPASDAYKAVLLVANVVARPGVATNALDESKVPWWVVQYMAPFHRMAGSGFTVYVHVPSKRFLLGKRGAILRQEVDKYGPPAGNWDYPETLREACIREGNEETGGVFSHIAPEPVEINTHDLSDYGGEKSRFTAIMTLPVSVPDMVIPPVDDETTGWAWATLEEVDDGTVPLAFTPAIRPILQKVADYFGF